MFASCHMTFSIGNGGGNEYVSSMAMSMPRSPPPSVPQFRGGIGVGGIVGGIGFGAGVAPPLHRPPLPSVPRYNGDGVGGAPIPRPMGLSPVVGGGMDGRNIRRGGGETFYNGTRGASNCGGGGGSGVGTRACRPA
mmetsp:Transcript_86838/g.245980  ORF Transcript_86838/g.245980 Transcript_86838/m.245980 type:complete len:136 (+) Transcript_86838:1241-1648(+)